MNEPVPGYEPGLSDDPESSHRDSICQECHHAKHVGICQHPITDDIYASADPYGLGPARVFVRSIITDICHCNPKVETTQ